MPLLTEALAGALLPFLDKPFAIFGHGLGAAIGFELTRHLRKTSQTGPLHLLVAGRRAPQMPNDSSPIFDLPDPEFIAAVRDLNTIPAEVLEHPELMELMLPVLRADYKLAETYVYRAEPPLDVPIAAYGGEQDSRATREELERWQEQTIAGFNLRMFPGDHFFLHSAQARLLEAISRDWAAI
jgi:medium-chain acyl-[acyl-carrier-protein] hydrolase